MERWIPAYARMFDPDHELALGEPRCPAFAWLDLCYMAQYEDGVRVVRGQVVPLKRSELVASLRFLATRWRWSVKRVRTYLELLGSAEIGKLGTVKETPVGTVYSIVSYDFWANPGHTTKQGAGARSGHTRGTPEAQAGHKEQQVTSSTIKLLWSIWIEELGGSGREPSLTDTRRKKLTALYREKLQAESDPLETFRKILRAVKRSEHHMGTRAYQYPESLFRSADRRDRWFQAGLSTNGTGQKPATRNPTPWIPKDG